MIKKLADPSTRIGNEKGVIMKKLRYLIILFAIILASCAPPDGTKPEIPEAKSEDSSMISIFIDCVEGFNAPKIVSPNIVIIDPSPPHTFNWSISCNLDEYIIAVYPQEVGAQGPVILDGFVSSKPQYTSNVQLDPATTYRWTVTAISDVGTEESHNGWFTTGPVCDLGDLVAPALIRPADGSFEKGKGWGYIDEVNYAISYPAETCTPVGFVVDFSLNPDFSGEDWWNVGQPGSFAMVEDGVLLYKNDTNSLKDCEFYFWHAQAYVNYAGNEFGPFSETFSFYTDFEGECMVISEFKSIMNANCRSGPWVGENYLGIIREGETAMLLGLNEDASWGNFRLDNDIECWANMKTVEMQGAIFDPRFFQVLEHTLPPEDAPPLPEDSSPPPEDDQQGCIAPDRGGDLVCQIPCPDPSYAARVCSL